MKVQKISVNAGFSLSEQRRHIRHRRMFLLPQRLFLPSYCMKSESVAQQIENGKVFFSRKYPDMKFLAYFQSYTNTSWKRCGFTSQTV